MSFEVMSRKRKTGTTCLLKSSSSLNSFPRDLIEPSCAADHSWTLTDTNKYNVGARAKPKKQEFHLCNELDNDFQSEEKTSAQVTPEVASIVKLPLSSFNHIARYYHNNWIAFAANILETSLLL